MGFLSRSIAAYFVTQFFCLAFGAINIVQSSQATPYQRAAKALMSALEDGEHQGKNRITDLYSLAQNKEKLLPGGSNDVYVAIGTKAAVYLSKNLPQNVKLTYCMVANAEELKTSGAIRGNGVSTDVPLDVQFRLVKQTMPRAQAIGVLYRSDDPKSQEKMTSAQRAAPPEWKIEAINIAKHNSVSDAIKKLCKQNIDIIWTQSDRAVFTPAVIRSLLLTSLRKRIPVFGFSVPFVKSGALVGIGINPDCQGKQVAEIVSSLEARDSTPNDPDSSLSTSVDKCDFEIAINLIVAENLSIKVPPAIIEKATYIYRAN